ncbi:MAG: hypothetical protein ACP5GZ_01050 [Vulcanisaeta sp.]|uniref:hypothetical protein n=1 Tax=Vulcanisaeta sp. TaxID=2020871 RepID=UPI003D13057B
MRLSIVGSILISLIIGLALGYSIPTITHPTHYKNEPNLKCNNSITICIAISRCR